METIQAPASLLFGIRGQSHMLRIGRVKLLLCSAHLHEFRRRRGERPFPRVELELQSCNKKPEWSSYQK